LFSVRVAAGDDPAALSDEDKVSALAFFRALFHIWSNAHRQHLSGPLDPRLWAAAVQEMSA